MTVIQAIARVLSAGDALPLHVIHARVVELRGMPSGESATSARIRELRDRLEARSRPYTIKVTPRKGSQAPSYRMEPLGRQTEMRLVGAGFPTAR